jgi:tetratricopeptide (TPR) repeat protein
MAKILLLIFCSFIAPFGFAQNSRDVDSLMNILKQNKAVDSNRVRTLLNLAEAIIYNHPDSSMKYTAEAMRISQEIKWQKGIALSLRQEGHVHYVISDNVNSMDCYLKALKAGEVLNNKLFNASLYNNIANIYADLKDYKKALDYYGRYLAISQEIKSKNDEMGGLTNIGNIYTELNDLSSGLDYFKKALSIAEETGNKRISAAVLNNIGEILIKQKNYSMALYYFQKSIQFANENGDRNIKASALNGLGEIYLNQKNYRQAVDFSNRSLQLAKELNDISWQANALGTLSKTYEKQKNFAKALDTYKQSVILKDSSLSDNKKQEVTHLEMQYDFDKKEALIKAANDKKQALAAAEINKQKVLRNASIGTGSILLLAAMASIIFYKRRKDAIEKEKEAEFSAQVADTEMKALRAQMNPHFIFNSLNSINDYIDKNDTAKATLYTTRFAKLMRIILENSEQKEIPLADDLKALELYMQLESMRLQNKFTYEIKVDEDIDKENTLIPPLILQPFVENSIWHGLSKKQGEGKILIHIQKEGDMINCIVEDNGIGMHESANTNTEQDILNKKSLGMKITKARIDIINRLKKSNAAITMSDHEGGTKIEVKLPEALAF